MLRMNELNMRAARAEQRVLELEQLLREHALGGAHDDTCDDSEILTPLPQHVCLEVRWICFLRTFFKPFSISKSLHASYEQVDYVCHDLEQVDLILGHQDLM